MDPPFIPPDRGGPAPGKGQSAPNILDKGGKRV